MKANSPGERLYNGIIKENPTFVLVLGMCPTLAVTTAAINGIGMGLGFTLSITILAAFRELIGAGTVFGFQVMPSAYEPATIFILAPGAFFVLAFLAAIRAKLQDKKPKEEQKPVHCMEGGCASCGNEGCSGKFYDNTVKK